MTVSACASRVRGSTPALVTSVPAVPSASRSSATSRWIGPVLVLPAVVAASWAASIAPRLRVVNFSAPNWLIWTRSPASVSRGSAAATPDHDGLAGLRRAHGGQLPGLTRLACQGLPEHFAGGVELGQELLVAGRQRGHAVRQ